MLVLSRKIGEKILIGDNIVVEVRRVAGNRVTLAVEAPREVRILRGELQEAASAFDVGHTDPSHEIEEARHVAAEPVVIMHNHFGALSAMPHVLG